MRQHSELLHLFLISVTFGATTHAQVADTVFPRAVFIDPYWAGSYWCNPSQWNQSWIDSSYYYPQLKRMGITHSVTRGDATSLNPAINSAGIKIFNANIGEVFRYAGSVQAHYEAGGNPGQTNNAFTWPPATGGDFADTSEFPNPLVYRALIGTHQRGMLLESANMNMGDQPVNDTYYVILRAQITGSGNPNDSVAILRVWETSGGGQPSGHPTLNESLQQAVLEIQQDPNPQNQGPPGSNELLIRGSDFRASGAYVMVAMPIILGGHDGEGNLYQKHITLEWIPNRNLYIDYVDVREYDNYRLFATADSTSILQSLGDSLVATHSINPSLNWHWYRDEPYNAAFRAYARMSRLGTDRSTRPLNGALATPSGATSTAFVQTVSPAFLLADDYVVKGDSASTGTDNIQLRYDDSLIAPVLRPGIVAANSAAAQPIPFWFCMQTASYRKGSTWKYRDPTNAELLVQANLGLCYGVKGLMYFLYASLPGENCSADDYRGIVDVDPPGGLPRASKYVPNYKWYTLRDFHSRLDVIGPTLLNLHWINAAGVHRGQLGNVSSLVANVQSTIPGGASDPLSETYVEVGIFDSSGSAAKYFMIVNRRGLSNEQRNISITLSAASGYSVGLVADVYTHNQWIVTPGSAFTDLFQPGEGKLYRVRQATLKQGMTVQAGDTLTIAAGTILDFDPGKSLTVNGALVAIGSPSQRIAFDRSGSSGTWGGIVINSGGSANIQYCDITNASTGIHLNGVNSAQTIRHCNIASSANYGIQVSYLNSPYIDISYNTISVANVGIYLYYGTAAIDHNVLINTIYGIYGYQGGASWWMTNNVLSGCSTAFRAVYYSFFPLLRTGPVASGHNRATGVGSITLYAQDGSNIEAGGYDGIQGLNSFYGGGEGGQAVAMNYSTIVAQYNWWNYDYSAFADYTSTIDNSNPLDYDPNGGMGKGVFASQSGASATSTSVGSGTATGSSFFDAELIAARHSMAQGKYDDAITLFSQKFKSDTTLARKKYALAQLRTCYEQAKRNDFVDFLNGEIRPSLSRKDELFVESLELESIWLIDAGLYGNAAAVLEAIKSSFSDRPETYKHALFNLGNLYYSQLGNAVEAKECFEELKAKYPNDILTWHSRVLLGEADITPPQLGRGEMQPEEEPKSFAFLLNYPNPFNPSTTFKYALPAAGEVSLIVYDVLGRELAVVTTGPHGAGYYTATWNAAGTASGIYFARLTVKDELGSVIFSGVNKLLLMR